jgi:release factor glutamine methyltransferase
MVRAIASDEPRRRRNPKAGSGAVEHRVFRVPGRRESPRDRQSPDDSNKLASVLRPPSGLRSLYRAALRVRLRLLKRWYDGLRVEKVNGIPIIVLPGVFNGVLLRTGAFLATTLDAAWISPGARVLDLGTGSGIGAVFAARNGAQVVATDINPEAARCAQLNALAHHLERQIETRVGDLFEPVHHEKFDVVLFNPPFYRGRPRDVADCAWHSPDAFDRFLRELPAHLTPRGRALVILSSDGEIEQALRAATALAVSVVRQHDFVNETLTVYELRNA